METKRRKDCFFGLHFDFHANPASVREPIGGRLTEKMIREICEKIRPDFLQIDCKGHPGWTSYPTKLGNAAYPMAQDTLRLWRRVTKEYGVALFMHYSGVIDKKYVADHPDQARFDEQLRPDFQATSVFGSYVDDLLIPQLKELAGEYGVDGIWIDGEAWGTQVDFNPIALQKYYDETGIDLRNMPPVKPDMPYYEDYRNFCREGFRKYLRHYVDEVHKEYPDFQIASNWAFTDLMPEPIWANIDFISGDYAADNSLNTARFCARVIESQDAPWDLMSWNFRWNPAGLSHFVPKEPEQLKQEAAMVLSLGGGYQDYITMQSDGTPRMPEISAMTEVVKFCRERQPYSHKGRLIPQTAIFFSRHDHYLACPYLFHQDGHEPLRGLTQLLCETQASVDIRSEHNLLDAEPNRFPMIFVNDIEKELDAPSAEKLLKYAENGGYLVVSGKKALDAVIRAGASLSIGDGSFNRICHYSIDGERWTSASLPAVSVAGKNAEVLAQGCVNFSGTPDPHFDVAVEIPFGKGKIAAIGFALGRSYHLGMTAVIRELVTTLRKRAYRPIVEVTGSRFCDVTVMKKDEKCYIHLVNTSGAHGDPRELTVDEITPIGPLHLSIEGAQSVMLRPGNQPLEGVIKDGRFECDLASLHIHEIIEIK